MQSRKKVVVWADPIHYGLTAQLALLVIPKLCLMMTLLFRKDRSTSISKQRSLSKNSCCCDYNAVENALARGIKVTRNIVVVTLFSA